MRRSHAFLWLVLNAPHFALMSRLYAKVNVNAGCRAVHSLFQQIARHGEEIAIIIYLCLLHSFRKGLLL